MVWTSGKRSRNYYNQYHYGDRYSCSSYSSTDYSSDDFMSFEGPQRKRYKKTSYVHNAKEINIKSDTLLKSTCTWVINDYHYTETMMDPEEKIESPIFSFNGLKWRLEFYPKGRDGLYYRRYSAIYLTLVEGKGPAVKTHYSFSIGSGNKQKLNGIYSTRYFSPGQRFGVQRFEQQDALIDFSSTDYEDSLTISCDVIVELNQISGNNRAINYPEPALNSDSYTDVTLKVENKKIKVHKRVLASQSTLFAAMFSHSIKIEEGEEDCINLSDVSYKIMEEIVRFTYTGSVRNLESNAEELLAAASTYGFESLKHLCEDELCKRLNANNVVEMLNIAELHDASKIKEEAFKYFVERVNKAFITLQSVDKLPPALLTKLIKNTVSQKKIKFLNRLR